MHTALALTRSRDRAEDLVQEALLRVWARMSSGEQIDDLRPYLMTTVRNLAKRPPRLAPVEAAPPEAADGHASDRLACAEVIAAIETLPQDQAHLLNRTAFENATIAEIAAETGLPEGTVASRVSRARARLRAKLGLKDTLPLSDLLDR